MRQAGIFSAVNVMPTGSWGATIWSLEWRLDWPRKEILPREKGVK